MICQRDRPLLLIEAPGSGRSLRVEVRRDYMVVGRDASCDIWLDDPHVSRTHAALQRRGNAVYLQDLGSSGGTFVGGTAITTARRLRPGEVVAFATVTARFVAASTAAQKTMVPAAGRDDGQQVAATRSKARWLSWTGSLVLAEGFFIAAVTKASLLSLGNGSAGLLEDRFGPSIVGVPAGLVGWGLAVVGFGLVFAGIWLHTAVASRRGGLTAAPAAPGPARCGPVPRRGA